jgi:hypothetical protein
MAAERLLLTLVCGLSGRGHGLIIKPSGGLGLPRWVEGCHAWGMSDPIGV